MATLPAEIPASSNQVAAPQVNPLANGFGGLSVFRQIGLMVGLAASIAIGFAVVLWSMEPDYQPLLSNLSNVDATEAVDVLKASDIPYKIDDRSGALLVASENVYDARLKLAALGITDNKSVGFELLDKEQSLGTSQFMENISFRRGLEGELSRTIASLNSVKSARVHLALPKTSVFVRDARKPTASVFVELSRGRRLQEEQVNAIINLVASSVPQLESSDVTIIDQNGRLLSEVGKSETAVESARQFSYTLKLEDVLNKRVQQILEPVIGGDKFKVQVSAEVDFTAVEQTQEAYNPEISVLRSEQTSEDERSGAIGAGGVPGALSNQPPGTATAPEVATAGAAGTVAPVNPPRNVRTQATRNFELDRSISHTKHQQGKVQRISVAVVVDNKAGAAGGNNTEVGTPWEPAELENFTNLVKSAVGFSEARGDTVTVINAAFAPIPVIEAEAEPETPIWETPFFLKMVKQVMALVLVLILVFAVLRPIMKSLSDTGAQKNALAQATANAQAAANAAASGGGEQGMGMPGMGGQRANAGGAGSALLLGSGQNYDMQLNSAQALVADNPERAAQVIRQWVTKDE